jgi:tetratricopeptide (TPR) repeat protein
MALVQSERIDEARELCSGWLESRDPTRRAEAHKCLANVEGAAARTIMIEGDDLGGGRIRAGFAGEALDRALAHLDEAIGLAPADLSIHQGRLHLLMSSGQFARTAEALRDSLSSYTGPDALEAWLDYSPRFFQARKLRAGVAFLKVLEARYPDEHRVVANIGAFLSALEEDEEAIRYGEKAVRLNPEDPINNWNLGLMYEYAGDLDAADRQFRRSLALPVAPGQTVAQNCMHYAQFAENKLGDVERACAIHRESCPREAYPVCRN